MSVDPIQRGRRWQAFHEEEGGLKDMVAQIQAQYLDSLAHIEPSNTEALRVMAMAHRVSREFERLILNIVGGAAVAEATKEHIGRLHSIPAVGRKYG